MMTSSQEKKVIVSPSLSSSSPSSIVSPSATPTPMPSFPSRAATSDELSKREIYHGGSGGNTAAKRSRTSNLDLDHAIISNTSETQISPESNIIKDQENEDEDDNEEEEEDEHEYVEFYLGDSRSKSGIISNRPPMSALNSNSRDNSKNNSTAELVKFGKGTGTGTGTGIGTGGSSSKKKTSVTTPTGTVVMKNDSMNKDQGQQQTTTQGQQGQQQQQQQDRVVKENEGLNDDNDNDDDVILSEDEDSENDDQWKAMNTELEYDMYNEKGELFTRDNGDIFLQQPDRYLGGGGGGDSEDSKLGYTRVAAEEQAAKFNKINQDFDFLFKQKDESKNNNEGGSKLHHSSNQGEGLDSENKVYFNFNDHKNHTSKDDITTTEEMNPSTDDLNTVSQLKSTKEMLKDSQKIAYVGLVKLVITDMALALSKITVKKKYGNTKLMKNLSTAHLSFQQWSIKMMDRLYQHMELSREEKQMIENLSSHGIEAEDLVPSLVTIEQIANPLLNKNNNDDDDDIVMKTQEAGNGKEDDLSDKVLKIDIKWTLICDLFLNLIFDAVYDSRSRVLLFNFAKHINISNLEMSQFERRITDLLEIEESSEQVWNEKEIIDYRAKSNKKKKMMYVGLATLGGGLVIGLSAGLLAPVIGAGVAAGLSTVGITGTSSFLAGIGGTSIVTSVGVLSGARIGSKGMAKRVGDVKTFEFRPLHNNKRVNLIITVSGWMNGKEDDVRLPFSTVDPVMGDIVSLLWEPDMLRSTGQTINILATEILTQSIQQILGSTILIAFMASIQWPMALSKLGYLLDNPWNVSLDRAWSAGIILADTLIQRNLGVRPITLVGFSLGARLIYSCLLELSKRGAYGLVENVILFGSPVVYKHDEISLCRSVVSGKFVNGFSKKDWILGYLFRATSGGLGTVAGLTSIENVEGLDNFDCTEFVSGHMEYRKQMPKLLQALDWEVLNEEFVEIDEPIDTERQRELIHEFESVKDELDKKKTAANSSGSSNGSKRKSIFQKWFKPQKKEWWEVYDEGRKEVEAKQQKEADGVMKSDDDNVEPTQGNNSSNSAGDGSEVLFNIDAIMEEVVKIETELVKTPVLQSEEFKPRSFKTRSTENTPKNITSSNNINNNNDTQFHPRPFKSPTHAKAHELQPGGSNIRKTSGALLQNVMLDDGNNQNIQKEPEQQKEREEEEEEQQQEEVQSDKKDTEPPSYDYDDNEEFSHTGQDIKMAFA